MTLSGEPDVLVIGGANIDLTGSCHDRLIPGDSNPGIVRSNAGGVARNIAESLARLNVNCSLLSALGDDAAATQIENSCLNAGVDTSLLHRFEGQSSGSYLAIHNQLGTLLAAISDMAIIENLTPSYLRSTLPDIRQYPTLVLDSNLPQATLEWLVESCEDQTILVDAVSATKAVRLRRILPRINLLKVNRDEAVAILNQTGDDADLSAALHQQGVSTILLSQGPQGATLYTKQGAVHKGAVKGDNANDTGAGDALFAGFIAAGRLYDKPEQQLDFAIACATLTLGSASAVHPQLSVARVQETMLKHWS